MAASASINYWPQSACARAFWAQQETPPYGELLAETVAWLEPKPNDRWLDLGCGCGNLTEAIWKKSAGNISLVLGIDCAAENARAFAKMREKLQATENNLQFVHADFIQGLASCDDDSFNGVVSGLAVHYADSYSEELGRWTSEAYDRVITEVFRVLRAGGAFVFSVCVPNPAWTRVALRTVPGAFRARNPLRYLKKALRMMRYGGWLTREARRGRFHYLPFAAIEAKLRNAGFTRIACRLSYAGQAYVIRCRKPV
jgi:ubiquinone/menaquinone biosynthesis C-methylase UbiE